MLLLKKKQPELPHVVHVVPKEEQVMPVGL
jgi:hypothetical protein